MPGYGLFGTMVATPGDGDALAAHLLDAAAAMHDVAGCRLYLISLDGQALRARPRGWQGPPALTLSRGAAVGCPAPTLS